MKLLENKRFEGIPWKWISVIGLSTAVLWALLPVLAQPSNCGGNSAALNACKVYVITSKFAAIDRSDRVFNLATMPEDDREFALSYLRRKSDTWLGNAAFHVFTGDVPFGGNTPKRILVVCATPFDNVPQRRFGRSPMAHAVGYANGECGLISPEDFSRLDLSEFQLIGGAPEKEVVQ